MPADFTDLLSYIQISLPSELCQDMSLEDAIKIVQELLKENKTLRGKYRATFPTLAKLLISFGYFK